MKAEKISIEAYKNRVNPINHVNPVGAAGS